MLTRRLFAALPILIAMSLVAGCSVRGGSPDPSPTPDDVFVIVTATIPSEEEPGASATRATTYIVREGDSLLKIAVQFDLTLAELQAANKIEDANSIVVGQRLTIPTSSP